MSYCVNCGVELGDSEKKCILCGCEVVNPENPYQKDTRSPYPKKTTEQTVSDNRKFYSITVTLFLLLPAAVSFIINIIYFSDIFWSGYVIGVFAFLWVCVVPPIMFRKRSAFVFLLVDYMALMVIFYILDSILLENSWFFPFAFPVITSIWILTSINIILTQKKVLKGFGIPASIVLSTGLASNAVNLFLNIKIYERLFLSWSIVVIIPALITAIILFLVEGNDTVKEELIRRFHF